LRAHSYHIGGLAAFFTSPRRGEVMIRYKRPLFVV
jgi:hypothetical protein